MKARVHATGEVPEVFPTINRGENVSIKLTEKAAQELRTLIAKEVESGMNLRPSSGSEWSGGCSGFMYKMGFDEDVRAEDRVEEIEGIRVAVDSKSYLYLNGTTVDYQDGLMGRGFVFNNPNATHTCGCNHSFGA